MNSAQQVELIAAQVAKIEEDERCCVITQANPLQLHLDVASYNGQTYRLKLDLSLYDIEPPALSVLDADGNEVWDRRQLPPGLTNQDDHPIHKRPFFCVPGTLEYHDHPLHGNVSWDAMRNTRPLAALVAQIKHTMMAKPTPFLQIQVPAGQSVSNAIFYSGGKLVGQVDVQVPTGHAVEIVRLMLTPIQAAARSENEPGAHAPDA